MIVYKKLFLFLDNNPDNHIISYYFKNFVLLGRFFLFPNNPKNHYQSIAFYQICEFLFSTLFYYYYFDNHIVLLLFHKYGDSRKIYFLTTLKRKSHDFKKCI